MKSSINHDVKANKPNYAIVYPNMTLLLIHHKQNTSAFKVEISAAWQFRENTDN